MGQNSRKPCFSRGESIQKIPLKTHIVYYRDSAFIVLSFAYFRRSFADIIPGDHPLQGEARTYTYKNNDRGIYIF